MEQKKEKYYFVSDAHLGSKVVADAVEHESKLVNFLDMAAKDATAIYLLGDIFDFWFEYRYTVPKGHTRFLGKMREITLQGIPIYFFTGNHDVWTFGYLEQECGVTVCREPQVVSLCGTRFFLAHGDGLGDKSLGFRFIRPIFHSRVCQWLFRTFVPPAIGLNFGYAWSKRNRLKHERQGNGYRGEQGEPLVRFVKENKDVYGCRYYLFGHRHIVLNLMVDKDAQVVILGDFISEFTYATFDGTTLAIENFEG